MKLYFENSAQRKLIAEPNTEDDAIEFIRTFCKDCGFNLYYIRGWKNTEGFNVYDIGNCDEFFLLGD